MSLSSTEDVDELEVLDDGRDEPEAGGCVGGVSGGVSAAACETILICPSWAIGGAWPASAANMAALLAASMLSAPIAARSKPVPVTGSVSPSNAPTRARTH